MPVMDEFKEERAAMKNATPKEKLDYFWSYYKAHVLITLAVIVAIVTLVVQIVNRKEIVFYAAMINTFELETTNEYNQGFAEYAEIDLETYDIMFDTTMYIDLEEMSQTTKSALEKMMVYVSAQEIDVVATDSEIFSLYANNEIFFDLREILTPEQIAKCEPYFYYIDQAVIDAVNAAQDAMNYDYVPVYPDPWDPESMENPIPIGIYLENSALAEKYYFTGEKPVLGVVLNTKQPETALKFIDYIFQ